MLIHLILQQVPPTPTPGAPPMPAPIEIPQTMWWDAAPETVGVWNQMNVFFIFIQVIIVAILVALFLGLLYRAIRKISL